MGVLEGVGDSVGAAFPAGDEVKAGVDEGGEVKAGEAGKEEDEETGEDRLEGREGDGEDRLASGEAGGETGDTELGTRDSVRFATTIDTAVTRGVGGVGVGDGVGDGVGAGVAAPGLGEGRGDPTFDATCRSKCFKILTISSSKQTKNSTITSFGAAGPKTKTPLSDHAADHTNKIAQVQQTLLCWSMHARNYSTEQDGLRRHNAVSIAHNTGAVSGRSHADHLASQTATQLSKDFQALMQMAEELTVTVKLLQYKSVCCPATAVRSSSRSYTPCR